MKSKIWEKRYVDAKQRLVGAAVTFTNLNAKISELETLNELLQAKIKGLEDLLAEAPAAPSNAKKE